MPNTTRQGTFTIPVFLGVILLVAFTVGSKSVELVANKAVWLEIQGSLDRIVSFLWPMAVALAAVGTATMAAFQMAKDLFHLRSRFNQRELAEWLAERAAAFGTVDGNRSVSAAAAEQSLVTLATAGEADALYSLETDKLAAQMAAAGRIVLDQPRGYEDLLFCLAAHWITSPGGARDFELVLDPPKAPAASASDAEKQRIRDASGPYLEAKARVATAIQRGLDGFQIRLDYRWKHWNQTRVFWLNFGFVMAIMLWKARSGWPTLWPAYLAVATLSGFVSPLAKDLVSALEALKGRKR